MSTNQVHIRLINVRGPAKAVSRAIIRANLLIRCFKHNFRSLQALSRLLYCVPSIPSPFDPQSPYYNHNYEPRSLPPPASLRDRRPILVSLLATRALPQSPRPHLAPLPLCPRLPCRASLPNPHRSARRLPQCSKIHLCRRMCWRGRAHPAHRATHEHTAPLCRLGSRAVRALGSVARYQGLEDDHAREGEYIVH